MTDLNKLPARHQLKRGGRFPVGQRIVKCDRSAGSVLGNPYSRDSGPCSLAAFSAWIRYSETPIHTLTGSGKLRCWCPVKARQRIAELAENPPDALGCWCKPDAPDCHLTVILQLIAEHQEQLQIPFLP